MWGRRFSMGIPSEIFEPACLFQTPINGSGPVGFSITCMRLTGLPRQRRGLGAWVPLPTTSFSPALPVDLPRYGDRALFKNFSN